MLGYQSAWADPASGKDLTGARWYAPGAGVAARCSGRLIGSRHASRARVIAQAGAARRAHLLVRAPTLLQPVVAAVVVLLVP
jgi:hypothetical protein